jgi:hypothetical protein
MNNHYSNKVTEVSGQQELPAKGKSLSEDKNNSHGSKDKDSFFFRKDSHKKVNASGTGYLCDDDEGRDEQFQND